MADVSLDDLIKKDKEQHKASRNNKVGRVVFRSSVKRSSLVRGSRATRRNRATLMLVNKGTPVLSRRNLSRRDSRTTGTPQKSTDSPDSRSSRTSQGLRRKKMRIKRNSSAH